MLRAKNSPKWLVMRTSHEHASRHELSSKDLKDNAVRIIECQGEETGWRTCFRDIFQGPVE